MKKQFIIILLYILTLLMGCQDSINDSSAYMPLSEGESQIIRDTEKVGREIYEKDQYAVMATDIMLEKASEFNSNDIRGWITCKRSEYYEVIFVSPQGDKLMTPCQVIFNNNRPQFITKEKILTEKEAAMFRARQHYMEIIKEPCSEKYNTVVLSHDNGNDWLVYALPAAIYSQIVVIGGHYRGTISSDGNNILSQRSFTKTCLNLPTNPPDMPPGAELAAYTVSHLLDDVPTEIHVFLSLLYEKPFYVVTRNGRYWRIEGDRIKLLK